MNKTAWHIAVVGAGPVGLALALHAARLLPQAQVTLFDARTLDRDVGADPRTLALSLGSVRFLERLDAWPAAAAMPASTSTPAGTAFSALTGVPKRVCSRSGCAEASASQAACSGASSAP